MSPSGEETRAIATIVLAIVIASARLPSSYVASGILLGVGIFLLRPRLMLIAVLLLISARSNAILDSLTPLETRPINAEWVVLNSDPNPGDRTWRVEARLESEHILIVVRNESAGIIRRSARGDRLLVSGTLRGRAPTTDWQRSRRLVGRLDLTSVDARIEAGGLIGYATAFRELLDKGAASMTRNRRALFTGLVYGDDRFQDAATADDFRAAGLGHLLAVSGQNVVFVLLVVSPALMRVRSIPIRSIATGVVLVAFGFVTRFEPSVTRALVMVGIAAFAVGRGAAAPAVRTLPIAVVGLLLIDPMLGFSLAFRLSVAATCGLITITPRLLQWWGDDGIVRRAVATTVGAQLGVAPLLLIAFGSISVVAVPANLMSGVSASFVMMWGLTAGTVAGLAPPAVASVLHLPTALAIWWIQAVAHTSARVPTGPFGFWNLALVGSAVVVAQRAPTGAWRAVPAVLLLLGLGTPLLLATKPPPGRHELGNGLTLFRNDRGVDVVVMAGAGPPGRAVELLREVNVGRIDLLVTADADRSAGRLARVLSERFETADIWGPPGHQIPGARVSPGGSGCFGSTRLTVSRLGIVEWVDAADECAAVGSG